MNFLRTTKIFFLAGLLACTLLSAKAQEGGARAAAGQQKITISNDAGVEKKEAADENDAYRHSATVQKLAKVMGISVETAATSFEVLNFAVLALLIGGFLVKTLPKTFRSRTTGIQKSLVDARTATEEAGARLNSVEERLGKLDGQIAEMRAQAQKDGAAEELRIEASVEEERVKILAAAEQEISAATVHAQRQLQQYAAELAIEQAARKLVISAETDRLLVQSFARRLGGDDAKGGEN